MKIRGLKLQTAIQLVSEGNLTPALVAKRIGVSVRELMEVMEDPLFLRRVKEVRRARLAPSVPKVVACAVSQPRADRALVGLRERT